MHLCLDSKKKKKKIISVAKAHPEISFFQHFLCSYIKRDVFERFAYSWLSKIKILHYAKWNLNERDNVTVHIPKPENDGVATCN